MPAETPLTARQQEIWRPLVTYVDDHGYPPTVREIGEEVGLASPSTAHAHLANLERVGLIKRDPSKPRAIEEQGPPARRRRRHRVGRAAPAVARPRRRGLAAARRGERRGRRRRPGVDRPGCGLPARSTATR